MLQGSSQDMDLPILESKRQSQPITNLVKNSSTRTVSSSPYDNWPLC